MLHTVLERSRFLSPRGSPPPGLRCLPLSAEKWAENGWRRIAWEVLKARPGAGVYHFSPNPMAQNSVMWSHLTARVAGNAAQPMSPEENETGLVDPQQFLSYWENSLSF